MRVPRLYTKDMTRCCAVSRQVGEGEVEERETVVVGVRKEWTRRGDYIQRALPVTTRFITDDSASRSFVDGVFSRHSSHGFCSEKC